MLTTAAGTIRPSKVLIVGAGVAGLQAIATARRLGAQVEGFDVRPETREQIESLGARFLDLGVSAAGEGGYARALTDDERADRPRAQPPPGRSVARVLRRETRELVGGDERLGVRRKYYGDDALVDRCVVTLMSNRALLLVGEPGTAKSMLSELLTAAISGD